MERFAKSTTAITLCPLIGITRWALAHAAEVGETQPLLMPRSTGDECRELRNPRSNRAEAEGVDAS